MSLTGQVSQDSKTTDPKTGLKSRPQIIRIQSPHLDSKTLLILTYAGYKGTRVQG